MGFGQIMLRSQLPYRFRGKFRKVPKPTMHDLLKLRADFAREEKNMLILRHPFLTVEQSYGHMTDIREKHPEHRFTRLKYEEKNKKFAKRYTIADHLNRLRVYEPWD